MRAILKKLMVLKKNNGQIVRRILEVGGKKIQQSRKLQVEWRYGR